jgi:IrrE N-terminal-like domain
MATKLRGFLMAGLPLKAGISYLRGTDIPACNLSRLEIEAYAKSVLEKYHFRVSRRFRDPTTTDGRVLKVVRIPDPRVLARQLGAKIIYNQYWTDASQQLFSLCIHGPNQFEMVLSLAKSSSENQFSVAHELGHYFLHSNQGKLPLVASLKNHGRIDWEAACFAAALVMPEQEVTEVWNDGVRTDVDLAARFGMSQGIANARRVALGLQ